MLRIEHPHLLHQRRTCQNPGKKMKEFWKDQRISDIERSNLNDLKLCYGANRSPEGFWFLAPNSHCGKLGFSSIPARNPWTFLWSKVSPVLGGNSTIPQKSSIIFNICFHTLPFGVAPCFTFCDLRSPSPMCPLSHGQLEACSDARRHAVEHLQWRSVKLFPSLSQRAQEELSENDTKCCNIVWICLTTFDFGMDVESLILLLLLLMIFDCSITPK